MKPRVAFVNIGQTPRSDVVPEILDEVGVDLEAEEFGVLDSYSDEDIEGLADTPGVDYWLVSRLRNGREARLPRSVVAKALQEILDEIGKGGYDAAVLLCTGSFPQLHCSIPTVEAGRVVDALVGALAEGRRQIGVLVPNESQVSHWNGSAIAGVPCVASHASPYTDRRFREASRDVADSDLIVMHCMGYDRAMRAEVAGHTGKPVILSRSVVAGALRQLV